MEILSHIILKGFADASNFVPAGTVFLFIDLLHIVSFFFFFLKFCKTCQMVLDITIYGLFGVPHLLWGSVACITELCQAEF